MSAILGAACAGNAVSALSQWSRACEVLLERSSERKILSEGPGIKICYRGSAAFTATAALPISVFIDGRFYDPVQLTGTPSCNTAENLAQLFVEEGPDVFCRLDGDYAITVIDQQKQYVYLVRDRWGMHPLYWAEAGGGVVWGSECKFLLPLLSQRRIDPHGLAECLMYRWLAGDRTLFHGIHRILPGSWVRFRFDAELQDVESQVFWRFRVHPTLPDQPLSVWANAVDRALADGVARRVEGVRSVATLLSGGVDSSLLARYVTLRPAHHVLLSPTWVGYDDPELDRATAYGRLMRAEHRVVRFDPESLDETFALVIRRFEQPPRSHHALTLAMLIPMMQEFDIIVHGEGADALFGNDGLRLVRNYARKRDHVEKLGPFASVLGASLPNWPPRVRSLKMLLTINTARKVRLYGDLRHRDALMRYWRKRGLSFGMNPALLHAVEPDPRDHVQHRQVIGLYTGVQDHLEMMDALFSRSGTHTVMPFLSTGVTAVAERLPTEYKLEPSGRTKPVIKLLASRYYPASMADAPKLGFPAPAVSWLKGALGGRVERLLRGDTPTASLVGERILRELCLPRDVEAIWTLISLDELINTFELDSVLPGRDA